MYDEIIQKVKAFLRGLAATEKKAEKVLHDVEEAALHAVHDVEEAIIATEHKIVRLTRDFLHMEAAGGILLVFAAIAAMAVANSPLYGLYHYILEEVHFRIGFSDLGLSFDAEIRKTLLHWINDGLMVVFFFLIGLEIKREFRDGELSSSDRAILPVLAALGGIAVPALFFWGFNSGTPDHLAGWAIPAATDIAFALGVVSLLGSRIPPSVKILLMAIAVIDDIGAILIIALFYAGDISIGPLYFAAAALAILFFLNRYNITPRTPYFLTTFALWVAVLESGIHASLVGVVAAMFIPMEGKANPNYSPLKSLEHALHPWVAFAVLPLFAFANAGVSFRGMEAADFLNPLTLGIAAGLVAGKQIGVFAMLWLAIKTGLSPRPRDATWMHLYAVSMLCGIGFTMSLFIGTLAFSDSESQIYVRMGVLAGSLASAICGYLLLLYAPGRHQPERHP